MSALFQCLAVPTVIVTQGFLVRETWEDGGHSVLERGTCTDRLTSKPL